MNKILSSVISLGLCSYINAQDINIPNSGWHLLGASEDLNISKFDSTCVDYLWKYNISGDNPQWELYKANSAITASYDGSTISSLNEGDGFWAKSQSACDINTSATTLPTAPEVPQLEETATSAELEALTSNNWTAIFHNISDSEQTRLEQRVNNAVGTSTNNPDSVSNSNGWLKYEVNKKATCSDLGGYYIQDDKTVTENSITKKTYKLQDNSYEAYCTEYIYSDDSNVSGSINYAVNYYKNDFTTDNVTPFATSSISAEDLNYSGFVMIYTNEHNDEYSNTCTQENQFFVPTGTITCSDFPNTSNCYLGERNAGTGVDCVTLSSDGYGGTTK